MEVPVGKYTMRQRLARGGMAELHLATARGPEGFAKTVVIKRLLPHLAENPQIVSMFLEEARLAAELHHPHIVQIYELGRDGEDHFICMEYLAGKDLAAMVSRSRETGRPIPVEIVAQIGSCIAQGLHFAHRHTTTEGEVREIVHGDISPANVVVTFVGEVKVVDFGIARAAGAVQSAFPGALQGKLAYLAPEQIARQPTDRRADIFALGVVLHELLTGERLFRREDETRIVNAILREPIPDPREKRPDVPARLAAAVMRALERDPEARFANADELRAELDLFLSEQAWSSTSARLGEYLTDLFGEDAARRIIAGPSPEPTATGTAAHSPANAPEPVMKGVPAVPLLTETRRGRSHLVRVVGEVPAALLKAGQNLVAVPLNVVLFAQRWTRRRLTAAGLALVLGGFAVGAATRELREVARDVAPAPRFVPPAFEASWAEYTPGDALALIPIGCFPDQPEPEPVEVVPEVVAESIPESPPPPRARLATRRQAPKMGKLVLTGKGTVYLQGAPVGEAPMVRRLPPGSYDVALLDRSGRVRNTWIAVVRPGMTTRLVSGKR